MIATSGVRLGGVRRWGRAARRRYAALGLRLNKDCTSTKNRVEARKQSHPSQRTGRALTFQD